MLAKIIDKAKPIAKKVTQYQYLIIGVIVVGLFTYTINIINTQLSPTRDESAYDQSRQSIKRVEFDEEAIMTIVRLRDLNVDVEAIFAPNRTNPFE